MQQAQSGRLASSASLTLQAAIVHFERSVRTAFIFMELATALRMNELLRHSMSPAHSMLY
jgi:hypothetical protein